MPLSIHDPSSNARKGMICLFPEYEAWYRFDGQSWVFIHDAR